jgi:hypothetical protein
MKKYILFIIALVGLVVCMIITFDRNVSGGVRFIARKGGKIEVSIVEGDPKDPIDIHGASKRFFRIEDEERSQFVSGLEPKPLGYFKEDYYYLKELHHSETNLKILDAKARIQLEIREVLEEGQEISILYTEPFWFWAVVWSLYILFFGFLLFLLEDEI